VENKFGNGANGRKKTGREDNKKAEVQTAVATLERALTASG